MNTNTKEKIEHTSTELRCQSCNRKLGEIAGTYRLAVKCPRCKQFNHFSYAAPLNASQAA